MPGVIKPPIFGIVYKATNKVNGKIYIGLTTKTLKKRISQHEKRSRSNTLFYFHQAIKKYGIDSFSFEVIETCFSKEDLVAKEVFYINEYQSFIREKGYNLTFGGDGVSGNDETRRKISESNKGRIISEEAREKQRKSINLYISIYGARKQTEVTRLKISTAHKGKKLSKENLEKRSKTLRNSPVVGSAHERKPVLQLDIEGNVLYRYSSVNEAARQTKINPSGISDVCIGKNKFAGGYIWRFDLPEYEGLTKILLPPMTRGRVRAVFKLDALGNVLERYVSIKEAAECCGLQRPGINAVCLGKQSSCGGFVWAYADKPLTKKRIKND